MKNFQIIKTRKKYSIDEYSMAALIEKLQSLIGLVMNKEVIRVKIVSDNEVLTNEIRQSQWQLWKTDKII